jgi:hypothetical protein
MEMVARLLGVLFNTPTAESPDPLQGTCEGLVKEFQEAQETRGSAWLRI